MAIIGYCARFCDEESSYIPLTKDKATPDNTNLEDKFMDTTIVDNLEYCIYFSSFFQKAK